MTLKLKRTLPRTKREALEKLRLIRSSMMRNPFFLQSAELAALLARFSAIVDQLVVAFDEARNHDSQKVAYRDQLLVQAKKSSNKIAAHAESIADGDESILRSTGYDLAIEKTSKKDLGKGPSLLAPVMTVELHPTDGTVRFTLVEPLEGAIVLEAFITETDSADAPNWRKQGIYPPDSDIVLAGLPKQPHALKVRGLGEEGAGEWSLAYPFVPL